MDWACRNFRTIGLDKLTIDDYLADMRKTKWWKIFRVPGPKELGLSDSDALPMRDFQSMGDMSPNWEEWQAIVKKKYPIRYFLSEELTIWCRVKYRRLVMDPWYWLVSHLVPSRRYHVLDLRQPQDDPLAYRWGWLEVDHQMEYALFNILNDYVKHQMPDQYCPNEKDIADDPHLAKQRKSYLEVQTIHQWWNEERKLELQAHDEALDEWYEAKKNRLPAEKQEKLFERLAEVERINKVKLEEMMIRLIKVRRWMWT